MPTEERAEWRGVTEEPDTVTVTVLVDGRAAIPVRAIPLFTRWRMSPDELAAQLARSRPTAKLRNTHAYHLVNAKPVRVHAAEWEPVVCGFAALESRIRRERPYEQSPQDDHEGLDEWIRESVVSLPEGVFVWRDEFVRDFVSDCHRLMSSEEIELLRRKAAVNETHYLLSYAPMELGQGRMHAVVFEGFQHPVSGEPETGEAEQQRHDEQPPVPTTGRQGDDWKAAARTLASEICQRDCANNLFPSPRRTSLRRRSSRTPTAARRSCAWTAAAPPASSAAPTRGRTSRSWCATCRRKLALTCSSSTGRTV